jgi:MFS family permease
MRALLSIRDARLYLAGQAASLLGDSALVLVLMIWVKELTGSSGAAGLVVFAFAAATLTGPLAGMLVDRVRRRPLLIAANLLSAVAVLPLLLVGGRGGVWLIYVVAVLYGISYATIASGQSALLAVLLPADLLAPANAALQTVREGLRLVAPLAGAGLFAAFGAAPVVALDAATFLVAAAALARMRLREPAPTPRLPLGACGDLSAIVDLRSPHAPGGGQGRWAELAGGLRHVLGDAPLRRMAVAVGVALLVIGFCESILFEVVGRGLGERPSFVGVVMAVQGAGAIVGGLGAAPVAARWGEARLAAAGMAVFAAGCLAQASEQRLAILAGIVAFGFGIPWLVVGQMTLLQRRTPPDLQGRAFSAMDLLTGTPQTVSIAVGAALVGFVDYRILLVVVAVVVVAAAAWLGAAPRAAPRAPWPNDAALLSARTSRSAGRPRRPR